MFLYHRTAAEACEDSIVELIDYCYRKFVGMTQEMNKMTSERLKLGFMHEDDPMKLIDLSPREDLERNFRMIEFGCTM